MEKYCITGTFQRAVHSPYLWINCQEKKYLTFLKLRFLVNKMGTVILFNRVNNKSDREGHLR